MQFTVDSSTLLHGLQKVARVSPTRSTMPILNHILFTVKGNVLSMRSTDIEITYTLNLNVLGEDDGAVALPVRLLQESLYDHRAVSRIARGKCTATAATGASTFTGWASTFAGSGLATSIFPWTSNLPLPK